MKTTKTETGYIANVNGKTYKIARNENEPAGHDGAWVVARDGEWVYEAATKRECVAWVGRRA